VRRPTFVWYTGHQTNDRPSIGPSAGKTLDAIAKMFGLKKMTTVENTRKALSPLMSSTDVFDAKVEDLRKRLTAKQKDLDEIQADDANDASNHE
jgi:hypothetical protein